MPIYGLAGGINNEAKSHYGLAGGVNKDLKEIYGLASGVNKKIFSAVSRATITIPEIGTVGTFDINGGEPLHCNTIEIRVANFSPSTTSTNAHNASISFYDSSDTNILSFSMSTDVADNYYGQVSFDIMNGPWVDLKEGYNDGGYFAGKIDFRIDNTGIVRVYVDNILFHTSNIARNYLEVKSYRVVKTRYNATLSDVVFKTV